MKNKEKSLNKVFFKDTCKEVAEKLGEDEKVVEKIISHFFYIYHVFTQSPFKPRITFPHFGNIIPRYSKLRRNTISRVSAVHKKGDKDYTILVNRLFLLKRVQLEGAKAHSKYKRYKLFSKKFNKYLKLLRNVHNFESSSK